MNEQVPAEEHLDKQIRILRQVYDREHPTAQWSRAHAAQLFNIITDLRASLIREQNSQQVLARENQRLRDRELELLRKLEALVNKGTNQP